MLPTLVQEAPEGNDWLHEVKYDGYRTQLIIDSEGIRAFTRRRFDWSDRYRTIIQAARDLSCTSAIIDGEAIVQDQQGRSDFEAFRAALDSEPNRLVFMAFDLLHRDGEDLPSAPLIQRRHELQELIGCHDPECRIQYSEHVIGGGGAMFSACDRMGLEGIVSKKLNSGYRSGRSKQWLKIKCWAEGEFVVVGFEPAKDGPAVALLARDTPQGLQYAGGAAITLSQSERDQFWRAVDRLAIAEPVAGMPKSKTGAALKPEMRVTARHLKGDAKLRHATLTALLGC